MQHSTTSWYYVEWKHFLIMSTLKNCSLRVDLQIWCPSAGVNIRNSCNQFCLDTQGQVDLCKAGVLCWRFATFEEMLCTDTQQDSMIHPLLLLPGHRNFVSLTMCWIHTGAFRCASARVIKSSQELAWKSVPEFLDSQPERDLENIRHVTRKHMCACKHQHMHNHKYTQELEAAVDSKRNIILVIKEGSRWASKTTYFQACCLHQVCQSSQLLLP